MDLATLEEANRLRVEMGLKPLPVPGQEKADKSGNDAEEDDDPNATLDGRHAQAFENFKKVQEADQAKRQREERAEAVKRAREKAQRRAVLEGSTLGETDGKDDDAKTWLRGQRKRQKKIEKQEEAAAEAEAAAAEAERRRLAALDEAAGVKIGHDMAAILGGDDQILTLKDSTVLENEEEGDELENMELREQEALQERLDLKKKSRTYDPLTMDEDSGPGSRSILGQYDEEIYGKKRRTFTLDPNAILGPESSATAASARTLHSLDTAVSGGLGSKYSVLNHVDIDDVLAAGPSSDYIDASEIKIKKPKKKSKAKKTSRSTRRRGGGGGDDGEDDVLFPVADEDGKEDEEEGKMEVDSGEAAAAAAEEAKKRKRQALDDADKDLLRSEDDLQAMLAIQRREVLKKRKRMRPEDVAKQLREASTQAEDSAEAEAGQNGGGLVIDETAEFISNLKRREDREEEAPRAKKQAAPISMSTAAVTAMEAESSDDEPEADVEMRDEEEEATGMASEEGHGTAVGLEEEKQISEGMGATLAILRGRGILESAGDDSEGSGSALNARMRSHQQFVAEKKLRLARMEEEARRRRENDRASGGAMTHMTAREREEYARRQNTQREFQTSRMLQDMFAEKYTPNFQIEYTDEHGRSLNQKEAFRALSHGFHGKSSGRGKTDKMLKRIAAEKRHMAEGILDASEAVGMSSAAQQQLKKRKEAGVRLD